MAAVAVAVAADPLSEDALVPVQSTRIVGWSTDPRL
jgi:hypothetical protein